jgi:hypothetical protein
MRLEVTVCHSIIEKCLDNISIFDRENKSKLILDELFRRRMVLHPDLEEQYVNHFSNIRPDLLDNFMTLYQSIVIQEDNIKLIKNYSSIYNHSDIYLSILINICNSSLDKILLTDYNDSTIGDISSLGISKVDSNRIVDYQDKNILNNYRLPIIRKVVTAGESSLDLSIWLSKFISTEQNFIIVDNYIYENRLLFLNFFLKYVRIGADIELYTMVNNNNTEQNIINTFNRPPFNKWKFNKINFVRNKKDQHARDIITDRYYIEIDKGMKVFGNNNSTHQANITIGYKEQMYDSTLPQLV